MRHIPVLLNETLEALNLAPSKNVIDCTVGDAGHAEKILEQTAPNGRLLAIDADPESILRAKKFLYPFEERVFFARDNFERLTDIVKQYSFRPVNGILMDFGWSSPQFEERGRGFSFQKREEPLDMRYDPNLPCKHTLDEMPKAFDGKPLFGPCTAAERVNAEPLGALAKIFSDYGEEKFAKLIAERIVEKRNEGFMYEMVGDLVDTVLDVYRKKLKTDKEVPWIGGLHPATKVFQALRIVVNDELGVIERTLPQAIDVLAKGGRLAVISFHSLEDRMVKHYFKKQKGKTIRLINKKPIVCSDAEATENHRVRSAKLRIIEKI